MTPTTGVAGLERDANQTLSRIDKELERIRSHEEELVSERERVTGALAALGVKRTPSAPAPASAPSAPKRRRRRGAATTGKVGARALELHERLGKSELARDEMASELGVSKVRIGQLMDELKGAKMVESRQDPRTERRREVWRAKGSATTLAEGTAKPAASATKKPARKRSRAKSSAAKKS